MRKITDIYRDYNIMWQLQAHQLRVAAVAQQICQSLDIPVDTHSIVSACLLHDMGNIIKFNLEYFPEFNQPQGIEYWRQIQNEYIEKYGLNEHHATLEIAGELGCTDSVKKIINAIDPLHLEKYGDQLSLEEKISLYADNRVTPHGIVSLKERSEEAFHRYKNHRNALGLESHKKFVGILELCEKEIFSHSNIKPEDITDASSMQIIELLKEFTL